MARYEAVTEPARKICEAGESQAWVFYRAKAAGTVPDRVTATADDWDRYRIDRDADMRVYESTRDGLREVFSRLKNEAMRNLFAALAAEGVEG